MICFNINYFFSSTILLICASIIVPNIPSLLTAIFGLFHYNLSGCGWSLEIDVFNVMMKRRLVCWMRMVDWLKRGACWLKGVCHKKLNCDPLTNYAIIHLISIIITSLSPKFLKLGKWPLKVRKWTDEVSSASRT